MATKFVMHIEAKCGRWSGVSTTVCGLTFTVEKASHFAGVTRQVCKAATKGDCK